MKREDLPDGIIWFPSRMDFQVKRLRSGVTPPRGTKRFHCAKVKTTDDVVREVSKQRDAAIAYWNRESDAASSSAPDSADANVASDTQDS